MSSDAFIAQAIAQGAERGIVALDPVARTVYAVSEAEGYCDMEGIDGLFDRYGYEAASVFAEAFASIGATEIAVAFTSVAKASPPPSDRSLSHLNDLIRDRRGYAYENITAYVQQRV